MVDACGTPEKVDLWTDPRADKSFMAAVRENRVMTLKQETVGTKKDFGTVGFLQERNVSYLVFPKSLTAFAGRRIVGVRYELVDLPAPVGRLVNNTQAKPRRAGVNRLPRSAIRSAESKHPPRGKKRFCVTFRFTATADVSQEIEAQSKDAAIDKAERIVRTPDFADGTVVRRVIQTRPVTS